MAVQRRREKASLWNRFRLEFQHLKLFKYKSLATYALEIIHTQEPTTYLSNVYKSTEFNIKTI